MLAQGIQGAGCIGATTVLGVMNSVGSMRLAVVRRLALFLVVVCFGLLLLLLGFRLGGSWFNTLNVLHEVCHLDKGVPSHSVRNEVHQRAMRNISFY